MNCWPKCSESQSHRTRAMMSFEPPAAKLTMKCTGRFGYFSCAAAGAAAQSKAKATQNRMMRMASLPFRFALGPWRIQLRSMCSGFLFLFLRPMLTAPAPAVDREPPRAGHDQQDQSADDRDVLGEVALLDAPRRRLGDLPIAVADQGRDDDEHDDRGRGAARVETQQDCGAAEKLDHRADPAEHGRIRHAPADQTRDECVHPQKLAKAALDEDPADQHAPDQQQEVLPEGEIVLWPFHSNISNPSWPDLFLQSSARLARYLGFAFSEKAALDATAITLPDKSWHDRMHNSPDSRATINRSCE